MKIYVNILVFFHNFNPREELGIFVPASFVCQAYFELFLCVFLIIWIFSK